MSCIQNQIKQILNKWGFNNVVDFRTAAKNGIIEEESIDDAIDIMNLLDRRDEIQNIIWRKFKNGRSRETA